MLEMFSTRHDCDQGTTEWHPNHHGVVEADRPSNDTLEAGAKNRTLDSRDAPLLQEGVWLPRISAFSIKLGGRQRIAERETETHRSGHPLAILESTSERVCYFSLHLGMLCLTSDVMMI